MALSFSLSMTPANNAPKRDSRPASYRQMNAPRTILGKILIED